MTETTITLPMGKADLQEAATAVIEQLATAPPDFSQMSDDRVTSYTMGVEVLCECLRGYERIIFLWVLFYQKG